MFPPDKISPDSSLQGMFVFFICSMCRYGVFLHPFTSLRGFLILLIPYSYLYLCTPSFTPVSLLLILSFICSSLLFLLYLSALCPAVEGSRLDPSSVSGKVTLHLAACPIRGPSLPGRATLTSVPPPFLLQHYAPAGSQMLDLQ